MDYDSRIIAEQVERGAIGSLLAALSPATPSKTQTELLAKPALEARLVGLQSLANSMILDHPIADLPKALAVAEAVVHLALRIQTKGTYSSLVPEAFGAGADLAATVLAKQGRYAEIVALARVVPEKMIDSTNGYRAVSLVIKMVDALIQLGQIEDAKQALRQVEHYYKIFTERTGKKDSDLEYTLKALQAQLGSSTNSVRRK